MKPNNCKLTLKYLCRTHVRYVYLVQVVKGLFLFNAAHDVASLPCGLIAVREVVVLPLTLTSSIQ